MNPATKYGDYVILRRIGNGNMGIVYLATRRDSGQQVAIKVIHGGSSPEDQEKIAIEENGAQAQRLIPKEESRVVIVNRIVRVNGDLVVEMEYIPGDDLSKVMQAGMPPERAAWIALELCRMLNNLDQLQPPLVHGDLKPRNILVCADFKIKVIDFGIAKQLARAEGTFNAYQSVPYSSPERIRTGMVNVHSDLWAVAVMLYQMAAGAHPFAAGNGDMRGRILDGSGPNGFPPDSRCPEPLRNIALKALASDLSDRYAAPKDMADDLQRFVSKQPVFATAQDDQATRRTHAPASVSAPVLDAQATVRTIPPAAAKPKPKPGLPLHKISLALKLTFWGVISLLGLYFGVGSYRSSEAGAAILRQLNADQITVADAWKQYDALRAKTALPLRGLRESLKKKLMDAGEEPIFDYRRDTPTAYEKDWDRAAANFHHLLELDPKDKDFQWGYQLCLGHLSRIRAGYAVKGKRAVNQKTLNAAIQHFEEAARLAPNSPDPYIGLARIYFYDAHDFDRGVEMLNQAAQRGHPLGKREKLERSDGLRDRANRNWSKAQQFKDMPAQYKQYLESAREDFRAALDGYRDVADFTPAIPGYIRDTMNSQAQVEQMLQVQNTGWSLFK